MIPADSADNWDDDFDLQPERNANGLSMLNDDLQTPLSKDKTNTIATDLSLHQWAEAGPSTPSKQRHVETENWDDDFQDKPFSPPRHHLVDGSPKSRRVRRQTVPEPEPENWDDDFEDNKPTSPSRKSARWSSSSDEEEELGFGDREEDRTVTSRSRRSALPTVLPNESPPPPVPAIPSAFMSDPQDPSPFPRSPTASLFSVPVSGRDSVAGYSYSSTAHLALRPTISGSSLGALPPSPPIHHARERRRLRKKSRPAHVEDNIYELDDAPPRPVTPERPTSQGAMSLSEPPLDATPSSAGRPSLVSRIGSVGRKWGANRKKRESMGPGDAAPREMSPNSRPQSMAIPSSSPSAKGGWFFRHGGAAGAGSGSPPDQAPTTLPLKHEKSVDRLLAMVGLEHPETPSKRKLRIRQGMPSDLANGDSSPGTSFFSGSPRRPMSMQFSASSRSSSRPTAGRHASYSQATGRQTPSSRSSSVARSASASVDDVSTKRHRQLVLAATASDDGATPRKSRKSSELEPEGKTLVAGRKRLSMHSKHQRTQSNAAGSDVSDPVRPSTSTSATAVPLLPLDFTHDTTPRPPSRVLSRVSMDKSLLPPIELQPPSPPREFVGLVTSISEPATGSLGIDSMLEPLSSSTTMPTIRDVGPASVKPPSSPPQSASLGRSTLSSKDKEDTSGTVPRRNSLGDLKIPARISQAQIGLRRDLGMVREFATSVEQLKELQTAYNALVSDVQALLLDAAPPVEPKSRPMSPTIFGLPRPGRARASTNPQASATTNQAAIHRQLATTYRAVEAKYRISWECAELLVELGGGPPATQPVSPPLPLSLEQSTSTIPSAPFFPDGRKSRERAITLGADEPKPYISLASASSSALASSSAQWRASTGRHDLSQRQLLLLRDMLNNPDPSTVIESQIPEEAINRHWHWGDGMNSTLTLPSEESSQHESNLELTDAAAPLKKRKSTRLGMRGIRDMLKSLRKTYSQNTQPAAVFQSAKPIPPSMIPPSSTSVSVATHSSLHLPRPESAAQRPRAKTSTGPESVRSLRDTHPNSPYATSPSAIHRSSPRRPSLASIFRLGQKGGKVSSSKASPQSGSGRELSADDVDRTGSSSSCQISTGTQPEEDDWDKIETSSELEMAALNGSIGNSSTVRGTKSRSPYSFDDPPPMPSTPGKPTPNPSRSSIWEPSSQAASHPPLPSPSSTNISQSYSRSTKLSDVREHVERDGEMVQQRKHRRSLSKTMRRASGVPSPSPKRPVSRSGRKSVGAGSLRSAHAPTLATLASGQTLEFDAAAFPDSRLALAMTPENIKPLLENAKEVHARCSDCIGELKELLAARPSLSAVS